MVEYGADLHTMDHGSGFPTLGSKHLRKSNNNNRDNVPGGGGGKRFFCSLFEVCLVKDLSFPEELTDFE